MVRIEKRKSEFDALGVQLAAVVKEWIPREIEPFVKDYWREPLFLDEDRSLYKLTHGGKEATYSAFNLLNPLGVSYRRLFSVKKRGTVPDSNLRGEGTVLGGELVFAKGGKIVYTYGEKSFGDHPSVDEILEAARQAAKESAEAPRTDAVPRPEEAQS